MSTTEFKIKLNVNIESGGLQYGQTGLIFEPSKVCKDQDMKLQMKFEWWTSGAIE